MKIEKVPHLCPKCLGEKKIMSGCPVCKGRGIVMGESITITPRAREKGTKKIKPWQLPSIRQAGMPIEGHW